MFNINNFSIIILGRSNVSMNECRQAIQRHSPNVQVITEEIDFTHPSSSWIPRVKSLIEHKDIAILVNNVGINTEVPSLLYLFF